MNNLLPQTHWNIIDAIKAITIFPDLNSIFVESPYLIKKLSSCTLSTISEFAEIENLRRYSNHAGMLLAEIRELFPLLVIAWFKLILGLWKSHHTLHWKADNFDKKLSSFLQLPLTSLFTLVGRRYGRCVWLGNKPRYKYVKSSIFVVFFRVCYSLLFPNRYVFTATVRNSSIRPLTAILFRSF